MCESPAHSSGSGSRASPSQEMLGEGPEASPPSPTNHSSSSSPIIIPSEQDSGDAQVDSPQLPNGTGVAKESNSSDSSDEIDAGYKNGMKEEVETECETASSQPTEEKEGDREDDDGEDEGVDPFSPRLDVPQRPPRRGSKTVNFRSPEVDGEGKEEEEEEEGGLPAQNGGIQDSQEGRSHQGEEGGGGGTLERRPSRQWTLGEGNPVYRLSLKLSPNLFNMLDIPGAGQHEGAEKAGYLTKLSGRSFPYLAQWKRRYCVLAKGRLYYYEREDSRAGDKNNGVINLEYFDQVAEAGPKECKKATNVFILTSHDRSFFDPGRHLFSADTLPDMHDWIRRLQAALDQIRNNHRPVSSGSPPTSTASPATAKGKKKRDEKDADDKDGGQAKDNNLQNSAKERRKKKEESQRSRKSNRVGVETQTTAVAGEEAEQPQQQVPAMTSAAHKGGVQLPGLAPQRGFQLPGMTPSTKEKEAVMRSSSQPPARSREGGDDGLPEAGPTLPCVTKQRVKGPQGRRAPQSHRRTIAAAALKKRASSLSALEYQDLNDNRSESSQEGRVSSNRDSRTPEGDLAEVEEEREETTPEREVKFDDIEDDLFFSQWPRRGENHQEEEESRKEKENGQKIDKKRSSASSKLSVEARDNRRSTSRTRSGMLFGNKLSRLRDTMVSMKRARFESRDTVGAPDHPDQVIGNSRWSCTVL